MDEIKKSPERLAVIEKIEQLERARIFDEDVEQDPPTIPLTPDKIKYANRSLWANFKRAIAYKMAYAFYDKATKERAFALGEIKGAQNLNSVSGGAIVTCNHFNAMDSFVMQKVFDASKRKGRMYRVIREGNYTSFPGFYGFLMRNCDTLPLSDNMAVMKKFFRGVEKVLGENNLVLIYPEQSMWWNYRKPKPLKSGAFDLAVKYGVPVIPCFITMTDGDTVCPDGFPMQIYSPFVGEPIYPDKSLPRKQATEKLRAQVEEYNKQVYEKFYGIPLEYLD